MKLIIQKADNFKEVNKIIEILSTDINNNEIPYFVKTNETPIIKYTDTNKTFLINNIQETLKQYEGSEILLNIQESDLISFTGNSQTLQEVTTIQMNAIVGSTTGFQVFNIDTKTIWYFNGTDWINIDSSTGSSATDYEKILFQKANGIFGTHTGNIDETTILVLDMDGGQFIPGDMMEFLFDFDKIGIAGNSEFKIRAGVTGTPADELIALMSGFGRLDLCIERKRIQFLSGNIIQSASGNNPTDTTYFFDPKFLKPLTYSANWKLSVTAQLGDATDTINLVGYKVKQSKSTP